MTATPRTQATAGAKPLAHPRVIQVPQLHWRPLWARGLATATSDTVLLGRTGKSPPPRGHPTGCRRAHECAHQAARQATPGRRRGRGWLAKHSRRRTSCPPSRLEAGCSLRALTHLAALALQATLTLLAVIKGGVGETRTKGMEGGAGRKSETIAARRGRGGPRAVQTGGRYAHRHLSLMLRAVRRREAGGQAVVRGRTQTSDWLPCRPGLPGPPARAGAGTPPRVERRVRFALVLAVGTGTGLTLGLVRVSKSEGRAGDRRRRQSRDLSARPVIGRRKEPHKKAKLPSMCGISRACTGFLLDSCEGCARGLPRVRASRLCAMCGRVSHSLVLLDEGHTPANKRKSHISLPWRRHLGKRTPR